MRDVLVSLILSASTVSCSIAVSGCGEASTSPIVQASETQASETQASETKVFGVKGMHCDGCVNAVTTKVSRVEGVQSCEVSLEDESATIVADPSAFANAQAAIEKLGYEVVPPAE